MFYFIDVISQARNLVVVDVVRQRTVAAVVHITANRRRIGLHGGAGVHGAFLVLSSGWAACWAA